MFKILKNGVKLPKKNNDISFEIISPLEFHILPNQFIDISLGFSINIQNNTFGQILIHPSLCKEVNILNGLIDHNDEVILKLENKTNFSNYYNKDQIIAKLVFLKSQYTNIITFDVDQSLINLLDKHSLKILLSVLYFKIDLCTKKRIEMLNLFLDWYPYIEILQKIYLFDDATYRFVLEYQKPFPLLTLTQTKNFSIQHFSIELEPSIITDTFKLFNEPEIEDVHEKIDKLIVLHYLVKDKPNRGAYKKSKTKSVSRFLLFGREH